MCPRGIERQPRSHFYASRAQTWREGFDLDPICFDTMGKHCAPCLSLRGRTMRICLVGFPNFNSGRQLAQLRQCARTTNTGLPTARGDLARHLSTLSARMRYCEDGRRAEQIRTRPSAHQLLLPAAHLRSNTVDITNYNLCCLSAE